LHKCYFLSIVPFKHSAKLYTKMPTPSNLTSYLSCSHLRNLELAAKAEIIEKPYYYNAHNELIKKQGERHELKYLQELIKQHGQHIDIEKLHPDREDSKARIDETLKAIKDGVPIIFQGLLTDENWFGYADFLVKVDIPSKLGDYSYIIEDTKSGKAGLGV